MKNDEKLRTVFFLVFPVIINAKTCMKGMAFPHQVFHKGFRLYSSPEPLDSMEKELSL